MKLELDWMKVVEKVGKEKGRDAKAQMEGGVFDSS